MRACYVPVPAAATLKVFVVAESRQFDFDLSDKIADLEMTLEGNQWPADILQISALTQEELLTFFDPERSIQVYGDSGTAQSEG